MLWGVVPVPVVRVLVSPSSPPPPSDGAISRIAVSNACGLNSHVRPSTLLSIPQALSLHFIEISPSANKGSSLSDAKISPSDLPALSRSASK